MNLGLVDWGLHIPIFKNKNIVTYWSWVDTLPGSDVYFLHHVGLLSLPLGVTWLGVGFRSGANRNRTVPGVVAGCSWAVLVLTHYRVVPGLVAGCSWAGLVLTHYRLVPGLVAGCSWAVLVLTHYGLVPGLVAGSSRLA